MNSNLENQIFKVKMTLDSLVATSHNDDIRLKVTNINRKLEEILNVFAQINSIK